jgi:hypothetical protein
MPPPETKSSLSARIYQALAAVRELRGAAAADPQSQADRNALREWQSARLACTHRDLLESGRYGDAAAFFLSDLYGAKDFRQRDADVEKVVPMLAAVLPLGALHSLAMAIELDALSEALDADVVKHLREAQPDRSKPLEIDEPRYAAAYRSGSRERRARQIELVDETGKVLDQVAHKPMVTTAMNLARAPARLAGMSALHDFLERGLRAFRGMQRADEFLAIIKRRETALMERLFAGVPEPFVLPA